MKLIDYLIQKHNIRREDAAWILYFRDYEGERVFNYLKSINKI